VSPELIEKTRQLMERTIEFVPHVDFDRPDAAAAILALRTELKTAALPPIRLAPGLAFVSGLVQSPLLTADDERYWFTWMNFLKFRAERNRRLLDLRHPDEGLVERIEDDLETALQARNHIVRGNVRLIVALAKKASGSLDQMSELISEGMTPLIRSVELFDIGLGFRFSTYATWAVRNQMLRSIKRSQRSLEFTTGEDAPSMENLPDKGSARETSEANQQLRIEAVHRLLSALPDRDRRVVSARFALDGEPHGQSLAEIADRVGLSKERVRQIVLNAISKMRESMTYDEFEAME
jgi:RNA polymerase sigma factor (sigma-70 family)